MMDCLDSAINNFNNQKTNIGKQSRPYGYWYDSWNIDQVIFDAMKYDLINKLYKKNEQGTIKRTF